jgi:hypothetical protein
MASTGAAAGTIAAGVVVLDPDVVSFVSDLRELDPDEQLGESIVIPLK